MCNSTSMEKEFVPYELALRMKQLGFDESCFGWYADETHLSIRPQYIQPNDPNNVYNWCLAPTFSQAFRWLRENHDLNQAVYGKKSMGYDFKINGISDECNRKYEYQSDIVFCSYEEAELACLDKLIEIVECKS